MTASNMKLKRKHWVIFALILLLSVVFALALITGSYPLSLVEIMPAANGDLGRISQLVIMEYRLPRILTAVLVGAFFAIAGAIFQTLMRNPLASPDVIGFSAGAGIGALVSLMFWANASMLPFAIMGGLTVTAMVIALAWQSGLSTYRLILVGIGMNFVLTALIDLMLSRIDLNQAVEMSKWLAGTLNNAHWRDVVMLSTGLVVMAPIVFWLQFSLDRLSLGQDIATALGIRITPASLALMIAAVVLTALAVTSVGPLPFVAFVAGPIARRLLGTGDSALLEAALVGALVTLLADTCARALSTFINIPTGVFTAFIGAPYLLWLLVGQIRRGQL